MRRARLNVRRSMRGRLGLLGWLAPLALAGCGYAAIGALFIVPDSDNDPAAPTNAVPVANVTTPTGVWSGDITIQYFLTDAEGDVSDIQVTYEFSTDGGGSWSAATTATEAASGSDGTTGLAAASTGTSHVYVWDSSTDVGLVNGLARLTILPIEPGPGRLGVSGSTASAGFTVQNNNFIPTVVPSTPSGNQSNSVPITYLLADNESDATDIAVDYSIDGGSSWFVASEVPGLPSEGTTGLATTAGGLNHVFVWNAFADVGGINTSAMLRITPIDPGPPVRSGTAVATGAINLLNQLIGTVIGANLTVINSPADVVVDSNGNLFIADTLNHQVQVLNTQSTAITVGGVTIQPNALGIIAGTGVAGFNGDNQLAVNAQLNYPRDVLVDASGHVFIADALNNRVRRVDVTTGFITTVAGTGFQGRSGDGTLATAAQLHTPSGIDFDGSGNLWIADTGNHWVRCVNNQSTNIVVAGVTISPNQIRRVAGSGLGISGNSGDRLTASLALLDGPYDVAVDGNAVHVADTNNHAIRTINTHASTSLTVGSVTIAAGRIDTTVGTNGTLGNGGDGGIATSATLNTPRGVAVNATGGHIYVADTFNSLVRVVNVNALTSITLAGVTINATNINTIAGGGFSAFGGGGGGSGGDGGASTNAVLTLPEGVAVLAGGHPAICDTGDNRVRVVNVGTGGLTVAGVSIAAGAIETVAGTVTLTARVLRPGGMRRSGLTMVIADQDGHKVVNYTFKTGLITIVAGNGLPGFSGDGGLPTKAKLEVPTDVTLDPNGHLVIADFRNNRIRAVNATASAAPIAGVAVAANPINTVAGGGLGGDGGPAASAVLLFPGAVAFDSNGNCIISEWGNQKLRLVNTSNSISTLAGNGLTGFTDGALTSAQFRMPGGIWVDGSDNVLVADTLNHAIRFVNRSASAVTVCGVNIPAGSVGTIAGIPPGTGPLPGFNGDNQVGTATRLWNPTDVARLGNGDVVLIDSNNQRIRKVSQTTGLVSTICGTGTPGFNGDGIPPVNAHINGPLSMTVDQQTPANLFFGDANNKRVRRFTP